MANVNINNEVDDQFYRYKMPKLIAKVEGKGNGIKTVIVNMLEIAKALHRPPTYSTKFFGCELGAQTQFDLKNDRFIVNGSHDAAKLQELLFGFIHKFVLCQECDNPETDLVVQAKKGIILQRCIACGHQGNIDMRHKLTTFILKNPPTETISNGGATPNKKDKKSGKKGKKETANGEASPEPGDHKVISKIAEVDDDDVDWGEDVSDAAVAQRMEALTGAAKSMTISDDLAKTPQERTDLFFKYVENKLKAGQVSGVENGKDILGEAERLDVKDKATVILVELLLDVNILAQIKTYRSLFLRFTQENPKAQKNLLGGLEQLIGHVHTEALLPKVSHILKAFYDSDILDEEVLIEWADKVSKKYVSKDMAKEIHAKAAPFIDWLKQAEEESSDDESEDDVEVVYSHTEKVGTKVVPQPDRNGVDTKDSGQGPEEDDDFNIDDIWRQDFSPTLSMSMQLLTPFTRKCIKTK